MCGGARLHLPYYDFLASISLIHSLVMGRKYKIKFTLHMKLYVCVYIPKALEVQLFFRHTYMYDCIKSNYIRRLSDPLHRYY
jgi:hypothetical protein